MTKTDASRAAKAPDLYADIAAFHKKFGLVYEGPPRSLDVDLAIFRSKFMTEELGEYLGLDDEDAASLQESVREHIVKRGTAGLETQLDALVDLVYVALGTAYLQGFDFDEAWRRVQAANMAKIAARRDGDGSDSARGSAKFDVVKPPGWKAADLSDLVRAPTGEGLK